MKNPLIKKAILFSFCLLTSDFLLQAQAPQGIPYQAIARNASGVAIASTAVKVRFSIRDSIATGPVRYQETHNPTTSALGLFSVTVGMGTVVSGTFSGINWGKNAKFLQVELDPAGGNSYTDLGTTQMMSVPYALFAGNVNGFPAGGIEGQIIANCGGQPTWTTNGVCPGRVSSLNCAGAVQSGTAYATLPIQASFSLSYDGGNGGPFQALSVASTGLGGLTASLTAGNFNNGSGSLSISISGTAATSGTASFALNIGGQFCNLQLTVAPLPPFPADVDGNLYQTVTIGSQIWFKENLKTTKYRNGDAIKIGLTDNLWASSIEGLCSSYNNDSGNNLVYGKLYNWYAVADQRGLCPLGWHVPSDNEWDILVSYLGGNSVAGGKMKMVSNLWLNPNNEATNESGFSALPGGYAHIYGPFSSLGTSGAYYSSSVNSTMLNLDWNSGWTGRFTVPKNSGFSVRCLKD